MTLPREEETRTQAEREAKVAGAIGRLSGIRGVPPEFIAIATEKVATINEAYGQIAKERGI